MADSREEAGGLAEKDAEISVVEKQVTEETNDPAGATEQSSGTALPTEQDGVPEFTRPESGPLEEVTPGLGAAEQVPRPGPSAAERTSSGPAAAAEEAVVEPRAVVPRPGPAQGGAAGPRAAEGLGQEADAAGQGQVHGDFQETAQIQDVGPTAPATDTERQEGAQAGSEKPETRTGGPRLLDTLDSQRAQVPEGTATVKVMLHPDIQIFTMAFNINHTMGQMKQYFSSRLKIPVNVLQILLLGKVTENGETLSSLGVTPNGSIQVDLFSLDEEQFPIKASKLLQEYYMPDVITVRVQTDPDTLQDVTIEIQRPTFEKPFLGGFRHKETGVEYHNAGSQTVPKKRGDKGFEEFCRSTQTVVEKKKLQATRNTTSTQMTKIGVYVSNITDKFIEPQKYVTADEYHARRLKAVIVIQTYFRRWHAINVVMRLKKERKLRLEWEAQEERRKAREKLERLRKEYGRRLYPRTKEDFELLYHALELWRQEELARINSTLAGAERKAALCALLEKEAQLIASIGRHKLNADEENQPKEILSFLEKCAAPRKWKAFDGRTTQMDTQFTLRARELLEIFRSISMKDLPQDERLDVLLTLKHTVKEHDCKLTLEIVELIDREADLMMRGVKECNLEGLRARICTLFLQYIKTPLFNPQVARFLKVPPDPIRLYHNIHFCLGCKRYLPSTDFAVSASSRTVGRCCQCCRLDNEARQREAFLKYKLMLRQLRDSEMNYKDDANIAFLIQQQDLRYMVENFWGSQSALSACSDLYELAMVRWDKYQEWSPWNAILLTKEEAAAHLQLTTLEKAYEMVFVHRIKHKHILAKNYFSQFPEMAAVLHESDKKACPTDLLTTKPLTPGPSL